MRAFLTILFGFACLAVARPATAQEYGRAENTTATGVPYYVFARAGEPTVQVMVLGSSGGGLYEIGPGTDLTKLLTLSGTVTLSPQSKTTVRVYRPEGGTRKLIYEAPLDEIISSPGQAPAFLDGDIVAVETKQKKSGGWRSALQVVTGITSITLLALRIFYVF